MEFLSSSFREISTAVENDESRHTPSINTVERLARCSSLRSTEPFINPHLSTPSEIPDDTSFQHLEENQFAEYKKKYKISATNKRKLNTFAKPVTSEVGEIIEHIDPSQQITHQTVFIFDITGSMGLQIESVKKEIVPVMQRLKEHAELAVREAVGENGMQFSLNFEVAIVGYRDFDDVAHFETHDFTSEIGNIETFLGTLKAVGGGDEPEDVKGGFIHALFGITSETGMSPKLAWKSDTASKSIYLITDAPAHGTEFHNSGFGGDSYSTDNMAEWLQILKEMKTNNISFNIIKINNKIDKMCTKFKELCLTEEVVYVELDISQQIVYSYDNRPPRYESFLRGEESLIHENSEGREMSTMTGLVEEHMSTIYRMTSAGHAREISTKTEKM